MSLCHPLITYRLLKRAELVLQLLYLLQILQLLLINEWSDARVEIYALVQINMINVAEIKYSVLSVSVLVASVVVGSASEVMDKLQVP